MVFCRTEFVSYLPSPWRDLAKLDEQILDSFKKDTNAVIEFMKFMYHKLPPYRTEEPRCFQDLDRYIGAHPTLCRSVINLLSPKERNKFSLVTKRVEKLAFREESGIFYSGGEYLGLPEEWRGPKSQEDKMISYIEEHPEDHKRLLSAFDLMYGLDSIAGKYPRLSLSAFAMQYRYRSNDEEYITLFYKVRKAVDSLIDLSDQNSILVKYGCDNIYKLCGWLCENDPTECVIETNQKILEVERKIANCKNEGKEPEVELLNELKGYHDTLKDLARPYRVKPDSYLKPK